MIRTGTDRLELSPGTVVYHELTDFSNLQIRFYSEKENWNIVLAVLGFELRASCLLGRCSATSPF
jgi:hypothetical protein